MLITDISCCCIIWFLFFLCCVGCYTLHLIRGWNEINYSSWELFSSWIRRGVLQIQYLEWRGLFLCFQQWLWHPWHPHAHFSCGWVFWRNNWHYLCCFLMALTDLTSAMALIALATLAAFRVSKLPTALSMALLPSMAPTPLMASTPSLALSS